MVIFLVGLVSMILMRTLRKDYARYSKEEEMDDMVRVHWLSSLLLTTLSSECKMTFLLFLSYINLICDFFLFLFLCDTRHVHGLSFWFFFSLLLHHQDRDLGDEYGWKQVHGDVFRPSSHPLIFSSLIGSGCQIFSVSLIVIIVAMVEDPYTEWVADRFCGGSSFQVSKMARFTEVYWRAVLRSIM